MTQRVLGPKGGWRRRRLLAVPILLVACAALFWIGGASAVHNTGNFELDGNATNNPAVPGDDWDNVCHQVLHTDCSTTSDTSSASAVSFVSEPNRSTSIFFGGGSKDPSDISAWQWKNEGGLPDKDNLRDAFAARYGNVLFFGSDRFDNSGDAQQGFWFFQNPVAQTGTSPNGTFSGVHKVGDLLILSDFSNGGGTSTINIYKWVGTGGDTGGGSLQFLAGGTTSNCANPTPDTFCGIVNAGTITMPWTFTDKSGTPNNGALNGEFYEGGVDLTALGLAGECFAAFSAETRSSTSPTATLKDFVLGGFAACGSSLTSTPSVTGSTSIGTGSVSVSDQATVTVTGADPWAGTVHFTLDGPGGVTADIGSVPIQSGTPATDPVTVTSATATVTSAGHYCWHALFHATTPSTGVPDAPDQGNECFDVTPVTPALATTAGPDVVLGNPITDTATLSGTANKPGTPIINPTTAGGPAGGSITFTLYGPNDCTTVAFTTAVPFPVSGDGTYGPATFTPTAIGTYHWVATYTGDLPNTNGTSATTCPDTTEDVVVSSVPSLMTSAQSFIPNDSATISASQGGDLAGTVTFQLFESSDCTGTAIYTSAPIPVSGASPQTVSTTNTTVSTTAANVSWLVSYDSTNPAQDDISAKCFENTVLAIANNGTVTSP